MTEHPPAALAAEWFTVSAGKITRNILVFDRPSFAPPKPMTGTGSAAAS